MATVDRVTAPHVVVLFGATGDLARRKLLPGLQRLTQSGLLTHARIVGTSLEDLTTEEFIERRARACTEFGKAGLDDEALGQVRLAHHLRPPVARAARAGGGGAQGRGGARRATVRYAGSTT